MNEAHVRELVKTVLDGVAPGADISGLTPDEDMRRTFGLDSLDFLNFSSAVLRRWVTEALAAEVGGRKVRQWKGRMP